MPKATFLPSGITLEVPSGTLVSDAAHRAGVSIDLPCGGKGTCGKCLVRITSGAVSCDYDATVEDTGDPTRIVLSCQASITQDTSIIVPEQTSCIFPDDAIDPVCEPLPVMSLLSPASRRISLQTQEARREDGLSDTDRIGLGLKGLLKAKDISWPLSVIRKTANALREENGLVTLTCAESGGRAHLIDITAGRNLSCGLGAAIDLGTTTVSVQLIDMTDGKSISVRNGYNDQIRCGGDIISRINYATSDERLEDLRLLALKSVNRLIREAACEAGVQPSDIFSCRISGNTVMTHLFLGLKPEYIRLDPYTPTVLDVPSFRAMELGLDVHPEALTTFSPCVGSYVGGDITAGILATDMAKGSGAISLFIDIGTNGEIVLGSSDFLMTCACSAGPAFEGGGIDCGMRATTGAIDTVEIDAQTGKASYTTIGGTRPSGICGSGLIDLVAGLFLAGWVDASGRLDRTRTSASIRIDGRRAFYILAEAGDSAWGKPVIISENDIDNLIRAKAAIYSAASVLLRQVGISFNDLSSFYIAGGFGRFLDLDHAMVIGLLPEIPLERYHYLGNASLLGSRLCILSEGYREMQRELARRMTYIDLSTFAGYMDQYTAALFLPHTDVSIFPGVAGRSGKDRPR